METEAGGLLSDGNLSYIITLLLYSGIGSWLVERFTRNRGAVLRERRRAIRENLELLDRLGKMRDHLRGGEREAGLATMNARLTDETCARIDELNRIAEEEKRNPGRSYLVLPPPRSAFAVFISLIFAAAIYIGVGALIVLGVAFFDDSGFAPWANSADMEWTVKMVGLSLGMTLLAFLARFIAYRLFNARTLRMRQKTGEG